MVVGALAKKNMRKPLKVARAANRHAIVLSAEEAGSTGSSPVRALHYGGNLFNRTTNKGCHCLGWRVENRSVSWCKLSRTNALTLGNSNQVYRTLEAILSTFIY